MASADNKRPFIAVMVKVFDSLDDGKQLLLSYAILLLGFVSCAAEIRNHLFEKAFVDVRVLNPCAQSNHQSPLASVYRRHEQEKRRQYEQRVCEVKLTTMYFHPTYYRITSNLTDTRKIIILANVRYN